MATIRAKAGSVLEDVLRIRRRAAGPRELIAEFSNRIGESPFREEAKLIVHCSHHKAGTLWLQRILKVLAGVYGLPFKNCTQDEWFGDIGVFIEDHSELDMARLPDIVGSHLIRDPRDMAVSAYFYHKWCNEPWVHEVLPKYGYSSLQTYLNSLTQDEGLMVEIRRGNERDIRGIRGWDYANPKFLEIKYEGLITRPEETFRGLFAHYGFNDDAISLGLSVADKLHFTNQTKRELGQRQEMRHLRSGRPGQWRDYFTQTHKDFFKEIHGDLLILLGYESTND